MITLDEFMAGWTRTTPEEDAQLAAGHAFVFVIQVAEAIILVVVAACDAQIAPLVIIVAPDAA